MVLDKLSLSRGGGCLDNKHKTKQALLRGGALLITSYTIQIQNKSDNNWHGEC